MSTKFKTVITTAGAAKLAAAPVAALGATRNLIRQGQTATLAEQLESEAKAIA